MLEERLAARRSRPLPGRLGRLTELAPSRSAVGRLAFLPLLLIVATAFTVTALFTRSIHGFSVMPDELGYVKQSIEIWKTGPPVGPHDFYFTSWNQLLPLISAPIFGGLGMVQGYYTAHTVYALLLASTAFPAYLLARELGFGRLAAYLVAALSVAVPWMVLAGLVMTEVVAYPTFAWAMLAMTRTMHVPSVRRDALAILAIALAFFARTQFVALGPILVVAVLLHDVVPALAAERGSPLRPRLVTALRQMLVSHRLLWACSGIVLIVGLGLALTGSLQSVLGNYIEPVHGTLVPAGTFTAAFKELDGVALGIGVIPVTLAASWALATAARPRDPARHAFAVLLLVSLAVFLLLVGSFDARFLGGSTTDRYLFYFVPVLFTGAAAWMVDRRGSLAVVALVGALVVWMVVTVGLHDAPYATLIDPSFAIHHAFVQDGRRLTDALGLPAIDPRVLIAIITSLFIALVIWSRRRLPATGALLVLTLPVLAYTMWNTGYVMNELHHDSSVVPANHPESLTWIDRLVPASANVGLVISPNDPPGTPSPVNTWETWWEPSFWNKTVQRAFILPGDDSFAEGFVTLVNQDLLRGHLTGLEGADYLVKLDTDTRFVPRGRIVTPPTSPLILYRLAAGAPLLYGTSGLNQYSMIEPGSRPFLRVFGSGARAASDRVSVTLQTNAAQSDCPCQLELGGRYGDVVLPATRLSPGRAVPVSRSVTVPAHGYAQLNLAVTGRNRQPVPWVTLLAVRVRNE